IEWLKVHDLPDHVRFTHARHIAKNIDCADCHGDVKKMARIEQVKTLQMGFCLDCHRSPKVNASINCQTCHY
ncbi:MAG: cytochrome c3 family protein, partial [Deltaproteobacteria bacterium]|nr:cytochrome c3 family protein [Deltaproteobacteria bacterium]